VRRTAYGFALLAIAAALAIAGCGGSSEAKPTITKAQFIKRGDGICNKSDDRQGKGLVAWQKKNPKSGASKAWQKKILAEVALPPVKVEIRELAALPTPAGDEATVKAIVSGLEEALKKTEADPSPLLKGPGAFGPVEKTITHYGFKFCVNPL